MVVAPPIVLPQCTFLGKNQIIIKTRSGEEALIFNGQGSKAMLKELCTHQLRRKRGEL
jgi:hypothetical protein